ncbi:uncharacterized protein RHIMIDRAFT_261319 [Rhizopus microsporus ATCC 52813]|uniref:Kinetochore protein NDC80 n=1 Tax=Rhizopus microsporus ATCC 52813 TaxID=1340429 RepID=A0A2G4SMF9_RHIZD|nr:uncharacterized protein RHIMIDRAFT_261319 [Rhizopus microsporus ATCC 52813]PHZ09940.1 hypothetical protein RHIMIDRAFT_261319 [Rhizopus microsporus ATCC 52813]
MSFGVESSQKRQSIDTLLETSNKIRRLSSNTAYRMSFFLDNLPTPDQYLNEHTSALHDFEDYRSIVSSQTSLLSEGGPSPFITRFNQTSTDAPHERKPLYDLKPFKDLDQQKVYISKISSYLFQTEYAKDLPSIRRSLRAFTTNEFHNMVKHLLRRFDPHLEVGRNFHEELPRVLKSIHCPLADMITPKGLLSIGAPHLYPISLALLHWLTESCELIHEHVGDNEDDGSVENNMFDENYFNWIFFIYACRAYAEEMSGGRDLIESNKELEDALNATDAMVDEMEEKSKRNSKKLLEELNQYNKDHPSLAHLKKTNTDLKSDIEKFNAYCEMKQKKIEKSQALGLRSEKQIQGFERELKKIETEIEQIKEALTSKGLTIEKINAIVEENKTISTEYTKIQKRLQDLQKQYEAKKEKNDELLNEIETLISEHNTLISKLAAIPDIDIQEDQLKITFDPTADDPNKDFPVDYESRTIPKLNDIFDLLSKRLLDITKKNSNLREELEAIDKKILDIQNSRHLDQQIVERRRHELEEREFMWRKEHDETTMALEKEEKAMQEKERQISLELENARMKLYDTKLKASEARIQAERRRHELNETYASFVRQLKHALEEIDQRAEGYLVAVKKEESVAKEVMLDI